MLLPLHMIVWAVELGDAAKNLSVPQHNKSVLPLVHQTTFTTIGDGNPINIKRFSVSCLVVWPHAGHYP